MVVDIDFPSNMIDYLNQIGEFFMKKETHTAHGFPSAEDRTDRGLLGNKDHPSDTEHLRPVQRMLTPNGKDQETLASNILYSNLGLGQTYRDRDCDPIIRTCSRMQGTGGMTTQQQRTGTMINTWGVCLTPRYSLRTVLPDPGP